MKKVITAVFVLLAFASLAITPYLPFFGPGSSGCGVTDWAQRVVNNGGTLPSQNTICAVENLRTTLITLGITNKIYSLCNFVPDSVIASATPLFTHKGYPMWTNNFSSAHLSINGLKGFGTNFMDTGITAIAGEAISAAGSGGMSVIVTEWGRAATYVLNPNGQCLMGRSDADDDPRYQLVVDGSKNSFFIPGDVASGANYVNALDFCRVGYISGNVTSNGVGNIFVASPYENHRVLVTKAGLADDITAVANTITVFGNKRGTTNELITATTNRMSMAMLHQDFTETESSNVWWALKIFRESIGGGVGNPVHDWDTFIVAQGGAHVSATTSNAACQFWARLNEANLGYKMNAVNIVAPDSMQAFQTPLIYNAGHPVWQNTTYGLTNLSVNGLDGTNALKYIRTGISNTTVALPMINTGGMTVMATNMTGQQIGGTTGAGNTHFTLIPPNGVSGAAASVQFYSYSSATLNTTYVVSTNFFGGYTNFGFFTSGNRLSNNAIQLYVGARNVPHYMITNCAGAAGQFLPNQEFVAFGSLQNNTGPVFVGPGPGAISYTAIHVGLTLNDSSNHYNAVYEMRTALGGGNR